MSLNLIILLVLVNLFIVTYFNKIPNNLLILDNPDGNRKIHAKSTPLFGGFLILFNIILFILYSYFTSTQWNIGFLFGNLYLSNIYLLLGFCIFFIGVCDDLFQMLPRTKIFLMILIFLLLITTNDEFLIQELNVSFLDNNINLKYFSVPISLLCYLLFINALNLFDGINLQVPLYTIIVSSYLFLNEPTLILTLVIFISVFFFIFLNFNGKSFLGDSGIFIIAYLLSTILVYLHNNINSYNETNFYADYIFIVMMLPGIELLRVSTSRIINNKNPFYADTNHIHHILMNKLSFIKTTLIIQSLILVPIILMFFVNSILIIIIFLICYFAIINYFKRNSIIVKK